MSQENIRHRTISLAGPIQNPPYIYVFWDPTTPRDTLKVGMTNNLERRMKELSGGILHPAGTEELHYLFSQPAVREDGTTFTDHDVHRRLGERGIFRLRDKNGNLTEFFRCSLEDVKSAYLDVVERKALMQTRDLSFRMRPEQEGAVDRTSRYFKKQDADAPFAPSRFLWNCKMRFGKTFAAYKLAQALGYKRILVFTFKPAVESAWRDDLMRHRDFEGWQFLSRTSGKGAGEKIDVQFQKADKDRPIVIFGSFQDLLGADKSLNRFKREHQFLHEEKWDLVIFDEYHFGAWRDNVKDYFGKGVDEEAEIREEEEAEAAKRKGKEEERERLSEQDLHIKTQHYLYLSGTPFRMLNTGEFLEDQIYSWTYTDEQRAKANWNDEIGKNPYSSLPEMLLFAIKLPDELENAIGKSEFDSFSLDEFFKAEEGPDGKCRFVHEEDVSRFLTLLHTGSADNVKDSLTERREAPWPYSNGKNSPKAMNHSVWFLKNVAECHAMKELLESPEHRPFYRQFNIVDASGPKAGIGLAALPPVHQAMGQNPFETKTIVLTCGKLTTGVTVRPWTAILMLRDLSSPETYFQSAFRIQSPWEGKDEDGNDVIYKKQCYIFDFSPTRALREIAEYGSHQGEDAKMEGEDKEKEISELISYLPVLVYNGSVLTEVDAGEILDYLAKGMTGNMLSRKFQDAALVDVSDMILQRVMNNPDALAAIEKIEAFRSLGKPRDVIEAVIGRSKKIHEIKERETATPEEEDEAKKQLKEERKQYLKLRDQIRQKLLKFITRIPVFMYLTDIREKAVEEVIRGQDRDLFTKVTGLTLEDFDLLMSLKLFNRQKMNDAVLAFRSFESDSLAYLGVNRHEGEKVAGFYSDEETDSPMTSEKADPVSEEGLRDKDEELTLRNDVPSGNNVDEKKAEEEPLTEIPANHVQLHEKSGEQHEQGNAIPAKHPFLHGAEGLLRGAVLEHASYGKVRIRWTLAFLVAFETEGGRSIVLSKRRFLRQGWRPLP